MKKVTPSLARKMIWMVDVNERGTISFFDFVSFMTLPRNY